MQTRHAVLNILCNFISDTKEILSSCEATASGTQKPGRRSRLHAHIAPRAGFEPATNRLTAECSTAELPRSDMCISRGVWNVVPLYRKMADFQLCYNTTVKKAYGMLGILFLIVFLIAYFALK